jgi:glycosyltransferase involved in cell wall biosynthesis
MTATTRPQVTILIPNYKTLELTKLCLRLVRKYTDPQLAHVIVIDNDSQDASLDYLRTLNWIELIERKHIPGETPALSHSRALDMALEKITTPFVLSIHTDTLVRNKEWLPFLLSHMINDPQVAGVGSWKLESKPFIKKIFKSIERQIQKIYYQITGKENHALEGLDHNYYYLRSHCALYRMDLLRQFHLHFSDGDEVAGKVMHRKLIDNHYKMLFLTSEELLKYMDHINHATTVLNPELSRHQRSVSKGTRRIQKSLERFDAKNILNDPQWDH